MKIELHNRKGLKIVNFHTGGQINFSIIQEEESASQGKMYFAFIVHAFTNP